jgi:Methyltransferase domain
MRCFACDTALRPYLTKDFGGAWGLDRAHYEACPACGLVVSRTHFELDDDAWARLNAGYHGEYLGTDANHDDPRWLERLVHQADVLTGLFRAGLTPGGRPWLDYGAGDGKLADTVAGRGVPLQKFDRFLPAGQGFLGEHDLRRGGFDLVLTTSVFEHVRSVEPLDEIDSLVADDGVMALHTLIRGEIPRDPGWFYLLPVHCTFLTNRAMALLLERWGYRSSLYHVDARLWCFARGDAGPLEDRARAAGLAGEWVVGGGFAAYWP